MAEHKKYLRAVLKECRAALCDDRAAALAAVVQARLIQSECYRAALTIVLYAAADHEVATDRIFADALGSGRTVYYPRIDIASRSITLARVSSANQLAPATFGIPQPSADQAIGLSALREALICVPGLAFTPQGSRLGRGGGYYDRLLKQIGADTVTVGLAYSFQVLDSIPETPLDQRLDFLVTDWATYAAARSHSKSGSQSGRGGTPKCLNC